MTTRPSSPQPPGAPRWVAMFFQPATGSWTVGAESPHREPVLYALGDMAQTVRARGEELAVTLWGPKGGAWAEFETSGASSDDPAPPPAPEPGKPAPEPGKPAPEPGKGTSKLDERMSDRRQQVLLAGLSKAGFYDLAADDEAAVQALVDRLDEATVRRVAHWLAAAGADR